VQKQRENLAWKLSMCSPLGSKDFVDRWTDFKGEFSHAQHQKCAWCEQQAIGASYGEIEHYRPKGRVDELSPDAERKEATPGLTKIVWEKGDSLKLSGGGYWWLAYEWSNYLLSCTVCNGTWKICFFPVRQRFSLGYVGCEKQESPLLLNPYDLDDLAPHLRYDSLGFIEGMTEEGRATVRTVGLARETLRNCRAYVAGDLFKHCQTILGDGTDDRDFEIALLSLRQAIEPRAPFPGMARIIVCRELGGDLPDLLEMLLRGEAG
jgi:hypothetical protein